MPLFQSSSRREIVATATMVVFTLSQWLMPQALVLRQSMPSVQAQEPVPARSIPTEAAPAAAAASAALNKQERISLKALNLTKEPTEAALKAAGGLGGALSPIGNADVSKYEAQLDTNLKRQGVAAGLRSTAPVLLPEGLLVAEQKEKIRLAKASNQLFGRAVQERNRRNFPVTAQLFRQYVKEFGAKPWVGPWIGEAHLHLAADAKSRMQPTEAKSHYEAIFKLTGNESNDPGYEVRQKAKQGWTALDISEGRVQDAVVDLTDILQTERDWRRWTWAAAWMRSVTGETKDLTLWACGNEALAVVLAGLGKKQAASRVQHLDPPRQGGFTLAELANISGREGVALRGFRTSAQHLAELPTPFIIHYGHEEQPQNRAAWSRFTKAKSTVVANSN